MQSFWVTLLMLFFVFTGGGQAWATDNEVVVNEYPNGKIVAFYNGHSIVVKACDQPCDDAAFDENGLDESGAMLMASYINSQSAEFASDTTRRMSRLGLTK